MSAVSKVSGCLPTTRKQMADMTHLPGSRKAIASDAHLLSLRITHKVQPLRTAIYLCKSLTLCHKISVIADEKAW